MVFVFCMFPFFSLRADVSYFFCFTHEAILSSKVFVEHRTAYPFINVLLKGFVFLPKLMLDAVFGVVVAKAGSLVGERG